jgi:MIP family channel proteins
MPDTWLRNAVAEAIGTFALCFVGLLVVASGADLTAVALANGVIILVFVAALGHVSGGHFNPAITLGMLLGRKIDIRGAGVYWAAQVIGALAGSLVVLLATDRAAVALGTPVIADGVNIFWAIILEAVATFFLVLVVFGTVVDQRAPLSAYPFAIGLAITAGVFAIGPFTGGALNPARGFGPALVSGEWGGTAAWLIGPLLGGLLAWAVFEYVIMPRPTAAVDAAANDVDVSV